MCSIAARRYWGPLRSAAGRRSPRAGAGRRARVWHTARVAKPRQQRMQHRQGGLAAIPQLEGRTDEQLLSESKHRAAARAILGARAAERDLIRQAMVGIFTELGAGHPLAREHRRRLSLALY